MHRPESISAAAEKAEVSYDIYWSEVKYMPLD